MRMLSRLAVGAVLILGLAPVRVTAETPEPHAPAPHAPAVTTPALMATTGCNFPTFRTRRERRWTNHVHRLTDLRCREARWVWRRRPAWRDEMPFSVSSTSTAHRLPSPASTETGRASHTVRKWCEVTTTTRYKSSPWPFTFTLFSVKMVQAFTYDGQTVAVGTPRFYPDSTANGFRWTFRGFVNRNDFYGPGNTTHTSEAWSQFATDGVLQIGSVHALIFTKIWSQANGDWATSHDKGLADCQND
jgi:hypothetical protein